MPPLAKTTAAGEALPKPAATDTQANEPTREEGRRLLEADLFNHALATDEEVSIRHSHMLGRNFTAHQERQDDPSPAIGEHLWERLAEIQIPLLMIYGREDRARAGERAEHLKAIRPELNLIIANGCRHLVHWDAADLLLQRAVPFLRGQSLAD